MRDAGFGRPPSSQRAGSSIRVPLPTGAGAAQSTRQSVVSVDEYGDWRVTLGQPQFENLQVTTPAAFGGSEPQVAIDFRRTQPIALVEWGADGGQFSAEVDWRNGCQFALSADYVKIGVLIQNLENQGGAIAGANAAALFPAKITRALHAGAPSMPPSRTRYSSNILGGGSELFAVPPFARTWSLQRLAGSFIDPVNLAFFSDGGATTTTLIAQVGPNLVAEWAYAVATAYTVPATSVCVGITNTGAGAATFAIEFGLDLG